MTRRKQLLAVGLAADVIVVVLALRLCLPFDVSRTTVGPSGASRIYTYTVAPNPVGSAVTAAGCIVLAAVLVRFLRRTPTVPPG